MRKNELKSLEELKAQYRGVWGPSDGHWLGLDFSYNGHEYRLHTGTMYGDKEKIDEKGTITQFRLYRKTEEKDPKHPNINLYELLDEKDSLEALLDSTAIGDIPFGIVIMDDETELLGQD